MVKSPQAPDTVGVLDPMTFRPPASRVFRWRRASFSGWGQPGAPGWIREVGVRRAFTLMELLVVVAILAILVAVLVPAARNFMERAAGATCAGHLRSLGAVLQAWRADHDGYFPTGVAGKRLLGPITDENQNPQSEANVTKALREEGYLSENETPLCPLMRLSAKGVAQLKNGESARSRLNQTGSYAINAFLLQVKPEALAGQNWHGTRPYPGDSRMLFLGESHCGIGGWPGLIWSESQHRTALEGVDYGTSVNVRGRHHGDFSLNFMFLDGHIARIAPKMKADGTPDWSDSFDSWGRDGKYINAKRLRE